MTISHFRFSYHFLSTQRFCCPNIERSIPFRCLIRCEHWGTKYYDCRQCDWSKWMCCCCGRWEYFKSDVNRFFYSNVISKIFSFFLLFCHFLLSVSLDGVTWHPARRYADGDNVVSRLKPSSHVLSPSLSLLFYCFWAATNSCFRVVAN